MGNESQPSMDDDGRSCIKTQSEAMRDDSSNSRAVAACHCVALL